MKNSGIIRQSWTIRSTEGFSGASPSSRFQSKGFGALARIGRQTLAASLCALLITTAQGNLYAQSATAANANPPAQSDAQQPLTPDQLDQLVAPIALYPDALVAQVLAASTYPTQVVEADRWRQAQGSASAA